MKKNIFVIDDDKMLRDTLALGLRKNNFNVICAESAESATQILNRISVDAIVLDRMMAGQDGLSFLNQIRRTGNKTPVIMLTALSGSENAIAGLSTGANDYMTKPFQLQELILRINNIINQQTPKQSLNTLPNGLSFVDNEFFVDTGDNIPNKLLSLSNEEKKLLQNLVTPVGTIVSATPMVAKRLRNKINGVLSNIDIITVRGMGYKMIHNQAVKK
ncbi:MAG: response regulator transcription factor [Alphaproteobacteria bacterium]|nr:response regulator transcription factor [Alphaproteobacteria bacterium]